jgi:hypothetical protein
MSPSLYAWGPKGHRIVALVAESQLTDAAKQGIRDLLDTETDPRVTSLPDAAIWPDLIRATGRDETLAFRRHPDHRSESAEQRLRPVA